MDEVGGTGKGVGSINSDRFKKKKEKKEKKKSLLTVEGEPIPNRFTQSTLNHCVSAVYT